MAITTRAGKGSALTHAEMDANLVYLVPTGAVMPFAMNAAPTGWLACSGQAVSRTSYADLFAAIGTTFGAGNGSTTFNLPDLRGEFVRGVDDGRGADTGRAFGSAQAQGTQDHKHRTAQGFDSSAFYGWQDGSGNPTFGSEVVNPVTRTATSGNTSVASAARLAYTDGMREQSGETRPRNVALLYCIKI